MNFLWHHKGHQYLSLVGMHNPSQMLDPHWGLFWKKKKKLGFFIWKVVNKGLNVLLQSLYRVFLGGSGVHLVLWGCSIGARDEKSRVSGYIMGHSGLVDSEINSVFKGGRTVRQVSQGAATGVVCHWAASVSDRRDAWLAAARKTSGVSTCLADVCDSFQLRTRRFQSLYSCCQRNDASFNSLRSNNKRPLTSFQESVKRKRLAHLVLYPRPQIAVASRWLSWKYFPLFFPLSRRHVNKAPSVAATKGRQWRRCPSNCEWDEC